jgi:hypothetical protein
MPHSWRDISAPQSSPSVLTWQVCCNWCAKERLKPSTCSSWSSNSELAGCTILHILCLMWHWGSAWAREPCARASSRVEHQPLSHYCGCSYGWIDNMQRRWGLQFNGLLTAWSNSNQPHLSRGILALLNCKPLHDYYASSRTVFWNTVVQLSKTSLGKFKRKVAMSESDQLDSSQPLLPCNASCIRSVSNWIVNLSATHVWSNGQVLPV